MKYLYFCKSIKYMMGGGRTNFLSLLNEEIDTYTSNTVSRYVSVLGDSFFSIYNLPIIKGLIGGYIIAHSE